MKLDEKIAVRENEVAVLTGEKATLLRGLAKNPDDKDVEAALARIVASLKTSTDQLALLREAVEVEQNNGPMVSAEELADAKDAAQRLLTAHAVLQEKIHAVFAAISENLEKDELTSIGATIYSFAHRLRKLSSRGKTHSSHKQIPPTVKDDAMENTAREALGQIPIISNPDQVYSLLKHRERVEAFVAAEMAEIEKLAAGQVEGVPEVEVDTAGGA